MIIIEHGGFNPLYPSLWKHVDGMCLSPWLKGLYGDFTGDGHVAIDDPADLAQLRLADDCALTSEADTDGDCRVNFYEFSKFGPDWKK